MTPETAASMDEASGIGHAFGRKAWFIGTLALVAGPLVAAVGGVYMLGKATHQLEFDTAYAEVVNKDGTTETMRGRGLFFTNPLTTESVTTWNPVNRKITIWDRDAKEAFSSEVQLNYMARDFNYTSAPYAAGKTALKNVFAQNGWRSYEQVNPSSNPANAEALCVTLADAMLKSLQTPDIRNASAGSCTVEVNRRGFTIK